MSDENITEETDNSRSDTPGSNGGIDETPDDETEDETEPDTFPRSYVQELREEAKGWRVKAQTADGLARRLHTELVRATGRLADPTDLPFSEDHLADADNMVAAVDDLLARKPHLAARKPMGDIGQGATRSAGDVSLLGLLQGK